LVETEIDEVKEEELDLGKTEFELAHTIIPTIEFRKKLTKVQVVPSLDFNTDETELLYQILDGQHIHHFYIKGAYPRVRVTGVDNIAAVLHIFKKHITGRKRERLDLVYQYCISHTLRQDITAEEKVILRKFKESYKQADWLKAWLAP
jgi:hypothetical protein